MISLTSVNGIAMWMMFKPNKPEQSVADKYQFLSRVKTYEVPQDELFSDEVDTTFYDRLGNKNVRFKRTKFIKQQEL